MCEAEGPLSMIITPMLSGRIFYNCVTYFTTACITTENVNREGGLFRPHNRSIWRHDDTLKCPTHFVLRTCFLIFVCSYHPNGNDENVVI